MRNSDARGETVHTRLNAQFKASLRWLLHLILALEVSRGTGPRHQDKGGLRVMMIICMRILCGDIQ